MLGPVQIRKKTQRKLHVCSLYLMVIWVVKLPRDSIRIILVKNQSYQSYEISGFCVCAELSKGAKILLTKSIIN